MNIAVEELPEVMQEIAELCGQITAMILLLNYGGCRFTVPKTPDIGHQLLEVLGWQRFKQLCSIYGGETLTIPKVDKIVRAA